MRLLISNPFYFDTQHKEFKKGSILIEDGIIKQIGQIDTEFDKEIDGSGRYLIPGLIDSHIHFFQSAGLFTRPDGLDLRHIKSYKQEFKDIKSSIPTLFRRYLATGITGVVDCGGPFWNFKVQEIAKSQELSPKIAVAGPLVSTVSRNKLDLGDPPIIKADNVAHARELVKACVEADPIFVKLWFIYQEDSFDRDSKIMKAAIEESHRLDSRVAVHATELETAKRAVRYGADILVHSVFTDEIDQEFLDLLIDRDVIYIPTIMVREGYRNVYQTRTFLSKYEQKWGDPAVISSFQKLIELDRDQIPESHRNLPEKHDDEPANLVQTTYDNLKKVYDEGITIASGTDAGNVGTLHGPSLHIEMEHMVNAGMTPADVLISTTKHGAQVMNLNNYGEITEGNMADLVLLDKDPLVDIKHTRSIYKIIINGESHLPSELVNPFNPITPVEGQLTAYNNRDLEAFLSYYHPRVKIYDFATDELLIDGHDEMRLRYRQLFEQSPELHATITNRIHLGNMVIDHEKVSGHMGTNHIEALAYYEVNHQKITRVWFSN